MIKPFDRIRENGKLYKRQRIKLEDRMGLAVHLGEAVR